MIDWTDKEERRTYDYEYYQKNKKKRVEQAKQHRERTRKALRDYKDSLSCGICGENDPVCLDFHHRDPSEKDEAVGEIVRRGWSIDHMMKEIAKCDVLCRNCHAKLHAGRFN